MKHKALLPFPFLGLLIAGLTAHVTARVYLSVSWLSDTFWLVHLVFPLILMGALIPALVIAAAAFLIPLFPNDLGKGIAALVLAALALVLAVAGIFIWPFYSMPVGCCFLFSGLFILPFPIGVAALQEDHRQRFRYLSFSGFGTFILVVIAAAFILSDGDILDGLDGFDFSDFGGSGKKKGK